MTTFLGFDAIAREQGLFVFGAIVHNFVRRFFFLLDEVLHELFWSLPRALFDTNDCLYPNSRRIGCFGWIFAGQNPSVRRCAVTLGVEPILGTLNLPPGGFENLKDEVRRRRRVLLCDSRVCDYNNQNE